MQRLASGTWLIFVAVVLSVALVAGCGGKQKKGPDFWTYKMPEGKTLEYEKSQNVTQRMDLMGQAMETKGSSNMSFTVTPTGSMERAHQMEITIDSFTADATTPQGEFSADTEGVIGASFAMTLYDLGKEFDFSGAGDIKYSQGPQGESSILPDFAAFFPDLPGRPVGIGDTWTSRDTIPVNDGGTELLIVSESVNTLQAIEKTGGMKSAMVTAKVNGTITGRGEQMGAPFTFDGTLVGDETWYFATEKGLFLKSTGSIVTTATVEVQGPQAMTIPITMNMTTSANLVK